MNVQNRVWGGFQLLHRSSVAASSVVFLIPTSRSHAPLISSLYLSFISAIEARPTSSISSYINNQCRCDFPFLRPSLCPHLSLCSPLIHTLGSVTVVVGCRPPTSACVWSLLLLPCVSAFAGGDTAAGLAAEGVSSLNQTEKEIKWQEVEQNEKTESVEEATTRTSTHLSREQQAPKFCWRFHPVLSYIYLGLPPCKNKQRDAGDGPDNPELSKTRSKSLIKGAALSSRVQETGPVGLCGGDSGGSPAVAAGAAGSDKSEWDLIQWSYCGLFCIKSFIHHCE